jgi:hypothetical protein
MVQVQVRIDPVSGALEGIDKGRAYSSIEFAALPRPTCPMCGTRVKYAPVRSTSLAVPQADAWLVGRASCPNGCNMVLGS